MINHEPSISPATPIRGRVVGTPAVDSCFKHSSWAVQTMPAYLATGCRVQYRGCESNRESPLYKRSQVGQTISVQGLGGTPRSQTVRSPKSSCGEGGGSCHQDSHFPSPGSGSRFYHMVTGQVGKTPPTTPRNFSYQSRDHTSYTLSAWSSVSDRSNMVREQRSRIRGKKNAIIQAYRHRPRWGQVVCFDEMGPLQTIPRGGKAWGKKANLRPDRYKRNGTLLWFCAFNPNTGRAVGKGFPTKSSECCRAFWLEHMLPSWPKGGIHLVMDNLSSHKKALRDLPARIRRRIHVYWTPTNSSWLNLVESYFAALQRTALHNTDYRTVEEIEEGLCQGTEYLNENPRPYQWKKV